MLECMKTKPAFALNAKELEIGFISQPVVDVDYASDPFLPIDPIDALESGLFATDVDVLLGSNQNEGFLLTEVILIQHQCGGLWNGSKGLSSKFLFFQEKDLSVDVITRL